jgi:hypothetical protein
MLFPILQALWQQIGPQTIQFVTSPAFPKLVGGLQRNAPTLVRMAYYGTESVSNWFDSLSPQEKKQLEVAGVWIIKDLSGDIIDKVTGLPIGSIIVEKALALLEHDQGDLNQ